jgi:hypothetical protein
MTSAERRPLPAPLAHTDVLVLDYLAGLWAAAGDLPPEVRDDLMATVADYIAVRRTLPGDDAEYVLRLLGPPEALAAAAGRGRIPAHLTGALASPAGPQRPAASVGGSRAPEYTALALLSLGAVLLPFIGPFAGLLVMAGSHRWTGAHKAIAAVVAVGTGAVGLASGVLLAAAGGEEFGVLLAWLAVVVGSIGAALTLVPSLVERHGVERDGPLRRRA